MAKLAVNIIVLFNMFVFASLAIPNYKFKDNCNKKITIPSNGDMMLTYSPSIGANKTCVVSVVNNNNQTFQPRVIAYFTSNVRSHYTPGCVDARLDIYDYQSPNSSRNLTGSNGVCGERSQPAAYYNTSQQYMTFKFRESSSSTVKTSFQILITSATASGNCSSQDFNCGNGYCISDKMVCNDNNNCGNHADEVACAVVVLTIGAILGICVGALVAVICIPLLIVGLFCRPRRRRTMYRQI